MSSYSPGDVVIASMHDSFHSEGKPRPVVLVRLDDNGSWVVACLTTQSHYKTSRKQRICVFASHRNGLRKHGYLWSPTLATATNNDIVQAIGVVDEHLAEIVSNHTNIDEVAATRLRVVARSNHPYAA